MALILETAAVVEPVTLSDVKNYLKIDHSFEDTLIASMITAARVQLETRLGRAFLRQLWSLYLDVLPYDNVINFNVNPVISIEHVAVIDALAVYQNIDTNDYVYDIKSDPAHLKTIKPLPKIHSEYSGLRVQFWAGYGPAASDVPAPIVQAILHLVAFWHENRGPIASGEIHQIPHVILDMIAPFKKIHI